MRLVPHAAVRGWRGGWPRNQPAVFGAMAALAVLFAVASGTFGRWVPGAWALVIVMIAGYLLQLRYLLLLYVVLVAAVVAVAVMRPPDDPLAPGVVAALVTTAVLIAMFVRTREALGVLGNTGQTMLVDLRDRLRAQALPPRTPDGLGLEVAQLSANGEGFSGDFVLSAVRPSAEQVREMGGESVDWPGALEVAVVDVSGKGQAAGTRALLLSGGLSGLLAGVRVDRFLPAANAYLLRQEWQEGFATALHLVVDPCTGEFSVRSAGHPPPVVHEAATGSWTALPGTGEPALGLVATGEYRECRGRLRRGDALVLFTDGVVENRGRDLSFGVDRLVGQVARQAQRGFRGAAAAGVAAPRGNVDDDRTVVVVWRE
ncbi:PP2C family protein-serine/threonine phosphatase [Aquipuribacter nitratireducens]|uniref:PP2C family protein-serine/threonine phosphatase n=1 Tax=Aquipuribacter nitratireducens TaxID=650104 RepID=A0ABW0GK76_9MICO